MWDAHALQRDLNRIYDWEERNNMSFNSGKFKVLQYGNVGGAPTRSYLTPVNSEIETVTRLRDLGVEMSSTGRFDRQIEKVVKKSRLMLGWALRTFRTRSAEPMTVLYKAVVLPHLGYCCQLWNPVTMGNIRKIDAVQPTFTARLTGMDDLNYWQRLEVLNMYSLERRRERFLIIYMWRVVNGLSPEIEGSQETELRVLDGGQRGKRCELPKTDKRSQLAVQTQLEGSLSVQGVRLFNSLPRELREIPLPLRDTWTNI